MTTIIVDPNRPLAASAGLSYQHTTDEGVVLDGVTEVDSSDRLIVRFPDGRWAFASIEYAANDLVTTSPCDVCGEDFDSDVDAIDVTVCGDCETKTVRVLVAIDVPASQATDRDDLVESIRARLIDEAGYLDNGDPITPTAVVLAVTADATVLDSRALAGAYEVGVEGVEA